ncbi:hypothetical protein N7516_004233 [Penicillium verrucosum]|uniref:uncharacterized protein n=1 Tax=Penicillium verrucosum TaxID=60171 RepID=UPI002544ECBF|nr:uncharacterized protein N7516_004233 [Penicillium verrucosum]KAJ5944065.1 hypothetical protein N7516_004233 [Penicillium verrucosum]
MGNHEWVEEAETEPQAIRVSVVKYVVFDLRRHLVTEDGHVVMVANVGQILQFVVFPLDMSIPRFALAAALLLGQLSTSQ